MNALMTPQIEPMTAQPTISERDGDGHLATQSRIFRLELVHFDDPLVRHELTQSKPSMTQASRSQGIRRPE